MWMDTRYGRKADSLLSESLLLLHWYDDGTKHGSISSIAHAYHDINIGYLCPC
jgi:hypothetical protein